MRSTRRHPVMGFNTFDGYGWSVTEDEFLRNVEFCDRELKPFGYDFMCLDFCWSTPGRDARPNPDQTDDLSPWLSMDRHGRLLPAPDRFPSSRADASLVHLADAVHDRGMKFGLHLLYGVPRQAVAARCPILGSDVTCDRIVDDAEGARCTWNNQMLPIDLGKPGAREYVRSVVALAESWKVDLLKVDDLTFPYRESAVECLREAIDACGREIVFSTSPGATPLEKADHVRRHADMWRISPDFWDDWSALEAQIERFDRWAPHRTETTFPDGDIIPVSKLSLYGPWPAPRCSLFTQAEKRTLLSVWSLMNSPLLLGGDLTALDRSTLVLLQNESVAVLDRHARGARIVERGEGFVRIEASIEGLPARKAVAVVNLSQRVLGFPGLGNPVVNVWGNCAEFLPPHDTYLCIV